MVGSQWMIEMGFFSDIVGRSLVFSCPWPPPPFQPHVCGFTEGVILWHKCKRRSSFFVEVLTCLLYP